MTDASGPPSIDPDRSITTITSIGGRCDDGASGAVNSTITCTVPSTSRATTV